MNFLTLPSLENKKAEVSIPYVLFQDINMEEQFLPLIKPSILVLNSGEDFSPAKEGEIYIFGNYSKLISDTLGILLEGYYLVELNPIGQMLTAFFADISVLEKQYPSYAQYYEPITEGSEEGHVIFPDPNPLSTTEIIQLHINSLLDIYELFNLPSTNNSYSSEIEALNRQSEYRNFINLYYGNILTLTINHPDVMYLWSQPTATSYNYNGICFMQTNRNENGEGIKYKLMVFGSLNTKVPAIYTTHIYKRVKIIATFADTIQFSGGNWIYSAGYNQTHEIENFTKNTGYTSTEQAQAKIKLYTALRNNNQYNQTKKNV